MSDFIGEIRLGALKVRQYKDSTDFITERPGVTLTIEQVQELGRWLLGEDEDDDEVLTLLHYLSGEMGMPVDQIPGLTLSSKVAGFVQVLKDSARMTAQEHKNYQGVIEKERKRGDNWEQRAHDWMKLKQEIESAYTVSLRDIERIVNRWWEHKGSQQELEQELWLRYRGTDPAVLVVRESEIAAVEVESVNDGKWWLADGALINTCEAPNAAEAREAAEEYLELAKGAEAVARAIEAKPDPAEEKARNLWETTITEGAEVVHWEDAHEDAREQFRILARHWPEQEENTDA